MATPANLHHALGHDRGLLRYARNDVLPYLLGSTIQRHRRGLHANLKADTLKAAEGSGEAIVQLSDTETGLLEDCFEDWRGLWEVVSADPDKSVQNAVALVTSLVAGGYLTTLGVSDWDQARTAEPMTTAAALAVVQSQANYLPPQQAGATFYLLSITPKGEAAIPPGAFPDQLR